MEGQQNPEHLLTCLKSVDISTVHSGFLVSCNPSPSSTVAASTVEVGLPSGKEKVVTDLAITII